MKTKALKEAPVARKVVFHHVAENLYRLESRGGYYALLKRDDKQFRRSLKTKDRKQAGRRLSEVRDTVSLNTQRRRKSSPRIRRLDQAAQGGVLDAGSPPRSRVRQSVGSLPVAAFAENAGAFPYPLSPERGGLRFPRSRVRRERGSVPSARRPSS